MCHSLSPYGFDKGLDTRFQRVNPHGIVFGFHDKHKEILPPSLLYQGRNSIQLHTTRGTLIGIHLEAWWSWTIQCFMI
jgi:hypothetical protein